MPALSDVFGERPRVARFQKLHPGEEQQKSLLGNIANFDDIAKLGELYKNFITSQTESLLPGYKENLAKGEAASGQLLDLGKSMLGGELPQDVKDQIQRSSAYTSAMGGFGGSGMSHNLTARDLGLNSLQLMQQGADMIGRGSNSAQQWSNMAKGDVMNPATQFISPEFQANYDLQNQVLKQQQRQMDYNRSAAPSPAAAGVSNTIMGVLGMYLGGGMGGGSGALTQGGKPTAVTAPTSSVGSMQAQYQPVGQSYYPSMATSSSSYQPTFNYDPNAFNDISIWGGG